MGSAVGTATGSGLGAASSNGGFTNRASNSLTVKSDKFAGFTVSAQYALTNANSTLNPNGTPGATQTTTAGGNVNWNGWGIGADYQWNKLYATAAYQSFNTYYLNSVYAAAVNVNPGAGATGGNLTSAGSLFGAQAITDKQTYAAATYDFGILKAYAQWVGRKIQQNAGTTLIGEQANRTAQQIGVRSYITPTIEAWGSIGNGKIKSVVNTATLNFTGWQLGSNYYLSKRTNLYAIYGQSNTSSASNSTTNAVTAGSGAGANQYAVGVRHTF
jgi:predicted porin